MTSHPLGTSTTGHDLPERHEPGNGTIPRSPGRAAFPVAPPPAGEKPVPADLDAERSTLGALLIDRDAIVAVAPWLLPAYFYLEKHAWIYQAVLDCYSDRIPPDVRTVSDALRRQERLDAVGGLPSLVELSVATPTAVHIEYYARIVERTAVLRRLIQAGGQIAALGYDEREDLDVTLGQAQELLLQVTQRALAQSALTSDQLADRAITRWSDLQAASIPTGLGDYDRFTGGVRRRCLTVVAARPSVGKTSWAAQVALNVAQAGYRVLIVSLEMSADEIEDRLAAVIAGIPMDRVLHKTWTEPELARAVSALGTLSTLPYAIDSYDDDQGMGEAAYTVSAVRNRALRCAHEWGKPDVVIVDFLQLLDASSSQRRSENRTQEIDRVVRALKALARSLACAVIVLSQLSREVEKRASHIPVLADLRESGAIEQIADTVVFIYRPILYAIRGADGSAYDVNGNVMDPHLAELHIAKQRNGPIGVVPVWVDLATGRWRDRATFTVPAGY